MSSTSMAGLDPLVTVLREVPPRQELEVSGNANILKRFPITDYIPDPRTTPAH